MNNINEWITDRSPAAVDGDEEGDVCMVTNPSRAREYDYAYVHWSYVGARAPWRHSRNWEPPDDPAPTDSDRITALEQRVAEIAALEQRVAALEHRVAELEAFKRAVTTTPVRRFA